MRAKIFTGKGRVGKTRVANMISEYVGKNKTFFLCARSKTRSFKDNPFLFAGMPDDTELLIVDDCPLNFDYSFFFPVEDQRYAGGDLRYRLTINEQCKPKREILIPQIIFTTSHLHKKWFKAGASFHARFEIVEFPLSKKSTVLNELI
ncbi:MAG: hypothetical protein Q8R96_11540 [Bacteroidota bacterium]|nr:hypothetical protein [Bacteroidota bacterium]